jgi:hypothetical protein
MFEAFPKGVGVAWFETSWEWRSTAFSPETFGIRVPDTRFGSFSPEISAHFSVSLSGIENEVLDAGFRMVAFRSKDGVKVQVFEYPMSLERWIVTGSGSTYEEAFNDAYTFLKDRQFKIPQSKEEVEEMAAEVERLRRIAFSEPREDWRQSPRREILARFKDLFSRFVRKRF